VTLDGHDFEPLPNGGCYVTTDGVRTFHNDQAAALRHIERMAGERAVYEARRVRERR
jgi:hypothetical protein